MAGTDILDAVLASGQNEGIERSVLPLPQMASIVNARQRKTGRWGKRFGVTELSKAPLSGFRGQIADNVGNTRCVGPGFCVVDDLTFTYDQVSARFVAADGVLANTAPATYAAWVPGAVSAWVPTASLSPNVGGSAPQQTIADGNSQAFFLGYLWTAIAYQRDGVADYGIRVSVVNPSDNTLIFSYELVASGATVGDGGVYFPKLVVCGGTLVLCYAARLNNAARGVRARTLTALVPFSAETVLDTNLDALGLYDVCAQSATVFALVAANSTVNVSFRRITAATLASAANVAYVSAIAIVGCSVVVNATSNIFFLLSGHGGGFNRLYLEVYDAALTALTSAANNAIVGAGTSSPSVAYGAVLGSGNVRVVFDARWAGTATDVSWFGDYTPTGANVPNVIPTNVYVLPRWRPISRPFCITSGAVDAVYCWFANVEASGYGFATLLHLSSSNDAAASYGYLGNQSVAAPTVEMSLQDFALNPTLQFAGQGLSQPIPLGSGAWSSLFLVFLSIPDASNAVAMRPRSVITTHHTGPASYRSVNAIATDGAQFVPSGYLARIGAQNATPVGFVSNPFLTGAVPAGGGALVPSTTYEYVAVYVSTTDNGRQEISGVSPVLTVALGAGQTQVTFSYARLSAGARPGAVIEFYRTLSNGSVFYRIGGASGIPLSSNDVVAGYGQYVDTASDGSIAANAVLYTQVGQTLPNSPPPPARFGAHGAQRVWLAGLFRSDIAQCSKLILGDQSPTFCDNDSFRIVTPSAITGLAFMDNLMLFTDEGDGGVYVVTGDGPDDSGNGEFSAPQRLPYAIGCIEPRSVISVDEGTFFQSRRGLYMIPRGFGAPIPAGDMVMDTLATYPIITGVSVVTKATEQTIHWTCVDSATPTAGAVLVYDLAHKCWSVDKIGDGTTSTYPHVATGQWLNGEAAYLPVNTIVAAVGVRVTSSAFADVNAAPIAMSMQSGDLRPFGVMSEGVISKVDTLAEVRSACTLQVTKTTENGTSPVAPRVFALAAGDYQVGTIAYTETELGVAELRDVSSLRIGWQESSTSEGLAFVALAVEHEQSEGLKRVTPLSRAT